MAVYSEADSGSLHVRLADMKIGLGGNLAKDTYLHQEKLLDAVTLSGADSVHPGYGFLAENSGFAALVERSGRTFVGPSSEVIAAMGDKESARTLAVEAGVPVVPGTPAGLESTELKRQAAAIGFPVLLKAVAGGSGRGMRVVRSESEFDERLREAQAEALSAFGNGSVFLEKYIDSPRHIEVQVFGDRHGSIVHFGERECSLQRRHQKIVEEAPAPNLHPEVRKRLYDYSLNLSRRVSYTNSGTLEFLVQGGESPDAPIYFLEMNTRIQVEHPVTELVHGVDLVQLQLRVAAGERLSDLPAASTGIGSAIEYRISAEDPRHDFAPAMGEVRYLARVGGPGFREDGWVEAGSVVSPYYDSLLLKVIVSGSDRTEALDRSRAYLDEYLIEGPPTTLGFHRWVVRQSDFIAGRVHIHWIGNHWKGDVREAPRTTGPLVLPPARGVR